MFGKQSIEKLEAAGRVDQLIEALADSDWSRSLAAVEALARIGDAQALTALHDYFAKINPANRAGVLDAMIAKGDTWLLEQYLGPRKMTGSYEAVYGIAISCASKAMNRLCEYLLSDLPEPASEMEGTCRIAVRDALIQIGDQRGIQAVVDWAIQVWDKYAPRYLVKAGPPAIGGLCQIIEELDATEVSMWWVTPDPRLRHHPGEVCNEAEQALKQMGPEVIPHVRSLLNCESSWTRERANRILAHYDGTGAT